MQSVPAILATGGRELGVDLEGKTVRRLTLYCEQLLRWNRKINLVARHTGRQELLVNHFLDSLSLVPWSLRLGNSGNREILDVGTGAGFPGLVLAIALPDFSFTLVEARQKRLSFLRHIVRTLSLVNVELVGKRIEQAPEVQRRSFSLVISRGVAPPPWFLELVTQLMTSGTRVLFMQGARGPEQWQQQPVEGFVLEEYQRLRLPFSGDPRTILVVARER